MTDYLELLLEDQKSEEESPTSEWKKMKLSLKNAAEQERMRSGLETVRGVGYAQENTSAVQSVGYAQEKIPAVQLERAADGRILLENGAVQVRDVTVELLRLRRAVRQAASRSDRPMERGGVAFEGEADFAWIGGRPDFKTADYATLVDTAFARDARRYDGLPGLL